MTRRVFLTQAGSLTALASVPMLVGRKICRGSGRLSLSEAFDGVMKDFMDVRKIPGGALAVVKDQRLVYVRGYGCADRKTKEPIKAESLFRIASLSKPFTATAILKLAQKRLLRLEDRVVEWLNLTPQLQRDPKADQRLRQITIRHCLHHTAGWDRDISGDPMFRSVEIAREIGVPAPARQQTIIQYMFGRSLEFAPGSRFAYSNFGYCVLGRVIEKASGRSYEQFVREQVMAPVGIRRMRIGASLENERLKDEVKYYSPGDSVGPSVFASVPGQVPEPYGTFCLEAMDSHGGWVASVLDLARFAVAMDAPGVKALLARETIQMLYEPPKPPVSRKPDGALADYYYGCGWDVRPVIAGKANYWHLGSLPGTFSLLVRRFDGISWVALFNQRSDDPALPDGALDSALHRAADAVDYWPPTDLF